MFRRILASILILLGGAAALFSVAKPWYKGRQGSTYQLSDLFSNIGATRASFANSLWVPMVVAAAFALLAFAWQQRWMALVSCVIVLGFTILWIVQQARADGQFVIASNGQGINHGVTEALVGGLFLLIGGLVMPTRGRGRTRHAGRADGRERIGSGHYRPQPEVAAGSMAAAETAAPNAGASSAPARAQEPVTPTVPVTPVSRQMPTSETSASASTSPELEEALKAADQVNKSAKDIPPNDQP
jgi:hypothetical protein